MLRRKTTKSKSKLSFAKNKLRTKKINSKTFRGGTRL